MADIREIRKLYRPVQPTVRASATDVRYKEILPASDLQHFIFCYWSLHTLKPLTEPFFYRVVADGCIDIFFELGSPEESFVMGFCKKYTEFPLEQEFRYVGIRFLPTVFPQLFGVDASELSNRYETLHSIAPHTAKFLSDQLNADCSFEEIADKLNTYFLQLAGKTDLYHDHRFYGAVALILQNHGVINVKKDLDTGLSSRQLRRLFQYYIGDTPKTFSKVIRFQNILRAKPSQQSLRENKLFFDTGYYDQAHFIKEFKNLYGVTPSKAFGR